MRPSTAELPPSRLLVNSSPAWLARMGLCAPGPERRRRRRTPRAAGFDFLDVGVLADQPQRVVSLDSPPCPRACCRASHLWPACSDGRSA